MYLILNHASGPTHALFSTYAHNKHFIFTDKNRHNSFMHNKIGNLTFPHLFFLSNCSGIHSFVFLLYLAVGVYIL